MKDYRLQKLFVSLVATITIDQISKFVAHDIILNTGVSFGLFPSSLLTIMLIGVLITIAFKFGRLFYASSPSVTGIFFGGSVSNIIDRLVYGGVRDFLPVPFFEIRNNLADWAIILALMWLFFRMQKSSDSNTV